MHQHLSSQAKSNFGPSRFWLHCALVVGAILLLATVKEVAVERMIDGLDSDGALINYAGRQRMLSQQIAKLTLSFEQAQLAGDPEGLERVLSELQPVVDEFASGHLLVQHRDLEGMTGEHSPAVIRAFEDLEASYLAVLDHAGRMLTSSDTIDPSEINPDIDTYLRGMNDIVQALADTSRQRHHGGGSWRPSCCRRWRPSWCCGRRCVRRPATATSTTRLLANSTWSEPRGTC